MTVDAALSLVPADFWIRGRRRRFTVKNCTAAPRGRDAGQKKEEKANDRNKKSDGASKPT
jgi:hypothetical protein